MVYYMVIFKPRPLNVTEATTLSFNGSQHMVVILPQEVRSQTEDMKLRFRSTRPLGLLVTTSTDQAGDRLHLALSQGRVKLTLRIGDKEKVLSSEPVVEVLEGGKSGDYR